MIENESVFCFGFVFRCLRNRPPLLIFHKHTQNLFIIPLNLFLTTVQKTKVRQSNHYCLLSLWLDWLETSWLVSEWSVRFWLDWLLVWLDWLGRMEYTLRIFQ